jgi:hypothetical protein
MTPIRIMPALSKDVAYVWRSRCDVIPLGISRPPTAASSAPGSKRLAALLQLAHQRHRRLVERHKTLAVELAQRDLPKVIPLLVAADAVELEHCERHPALATRR